MRQGELREFREAQGWTYRQLVELINAALPDRDYSLKSAQNLVSRWEKGERKMPDDVAKLLDGLSLDAALGEVVPPSPQDEQPAPEEFGRSDSTPPPPPGGEEQPAPSGGLVLPTDTADPRLVRLCSELWEMIATGVGMVGAVTGSEALREDGKIILNDKEALGKAYARLAETNATFRRMLTSMTTSGAWLEVAMVSGVTAGKMVRSHAEVKERKLIAEQQRYEAEDIHGDGYFDEQPAAA